MGAGQGYDRVLFTDRTDLKPEGIETRLCNSAALGSLHESRRAKLLPHRALATYEWVIYVDNRATLTQDPKEIVANLGASAAPGRYVYGHPERENVYDELDVCFRLGHIGEAQWRTLDALYRQNALPDDLTLTHNAVMLYKAGDAGTENMSEMWFELFLRYCKRDQLTMQVAEHLSGTRATRMGGSLSDIAKWPIFLPAERATSINPPGLIRPSVPLSAAWLRVKMEKKRRKALIRKQRGGH